MSDEIDITKIQAPTPTVTRTPVGQIEEIDGYKGENLYLKIQAAQFSLQVLQAELQQHCNDVAKKYNLSERDQIDFATRKIIRTPEIKSVPAS